MSPGRLDEVLTAYMEMSILRIHKTYYFKEIDTSLLYKSYNFKKNANPKILAFPFIFPRNCLKLRFL